MSTSIILTQAFLQNACETLEQRHNDALEQKRAAFKALDSESYNSWQKGVHPEHLFYAYILARKLQSSFEKSTTKHLSVDQDELTMIAESHIDDPHDAEAAAVDLIDITRTLTVT